MRGRGCHRWASQGGRASAWESRDQNRKRAQSACNPSHQGCSVTKAAHPPGSRNSHTHRDVAPLCSRHCCNVALNVLCIELLQFAPKLDAPLRLALMAQALAPTVVSLEHICSPKLASLDHPVAAPPNQGDVSPPERSEGAEAFPVEVVACVIGRVMVSARETWRSLPALRELSTHGCLTQRNKQV